MRKLFIILVALLVLPAMAGATDLTELFINGVPITGSDSGSDVVTGKVFYVGDSYNGVSGADTGSSGKSVSTPFATIDYALDFTVANRGDIIYLLPGHALAITSATTVALDVAGVRVIGLGKGSLRPTVTFGTSTAATFPISAANISIENILFVMNASAGADAMSAMVTITGADVTVKNCEFRQGDANAQAERAIYIDSSTSAADRVNIIDNLIWTTTDAGPIAGTDFRATPTGSVVDTVIANNTIFGSFSAAPIYGNYTGNRTRVTDNEVTNYDAGDYGIEFIATGTTRSVITGNKVFTDQPNTAIDPGATVQSLEGNMWDKYGAAEGSRNGFELFKMGEERTAVLTSDALPQSATNTLFVITGGGAIVTGFMGVVTTVIETAANSCIMTYDPAVAGLSDTQLMSTVNITADLEGSIYSIDFAGGGAVLNSGAAGFYATDNAAESFYVSPGALEFGCTASSSGNVTWTLKYLPAEGDTVAYTTGN